MTAGRFIAIVAVFVLLGPPIGAVLFSVLAVIAGAVGLIPEGMGPMLFYGGLMLLPLSYMIAGFQALVCGLATALWTFRVRPAPWFVPVGAALIAGGAYIVRGESDAGMAGVLMLVHAGTALICWRIARTL